MSLCCLETAILDTLRGLDCTKIKAENHFIDVRECTDCIPYLVLKTGTVSGLVTSSARQKLSNVEIKAYFSDQKRGDAREYKGLVEDWLFAGGCLDLGECGCLCVRGAINTNLRVGTAGTVVYSVAFSGVYSASEIVSASV